MLCALASSVRSIKYLRCWCFWSTCSLLPTSNLSLDKDNKKVAMKTRTKKNRHPMEKDRENIKLLVLSDENVCQTETMEVHRLCCCRWYEKNISARENPNYLKVTLGTDSNWISRDFGFSKNSTIFYSSHNYLNSHSFWLLYIFSRLLCVLVFVCVCVFGLSQTDVVTCCIVYAPAGSKTRTSEKSLDFTVFLFLP